MIPPVYSLLSTPAVTALVGTRIWQDEAEPQPAGDYIVWSLLSAVPENNLSRLPPGDKCSISVDVFAETEQRRQTITQAARAAIEAHGYVQNLQSLGRETDTRLWRMSFDADLFYKR